MHRLCLCHGGILALCAHGVKNPEREGDMEGCIDGFSYCIVINNMDMTTCERTYHIYLNTFHKQQSHFIINDF